MVLKEENSQIRHKFAELEAVYENQKHEYFIKYTKHLITKDELLDRHTIRNKLFIDWCYLYELLVLK